MKRILGSLAAMLLLFLLATPVALARTELQHTGRVLVSVGGDLTLPAGDRADAVVVVRGTATILGEVNTIVVVDGRVDLAGATAESIVAVRSPVNLGDGTVVLGDIHTLDTTVTRTGSAQVLGQTQSIGYEMLGVGLFLGPALLLFYLGLALAMMAAALLLVAIGSRQVRAAEAVITHEPLRTLVAGIAGIFIPPLIALAAVVTVVGAPAAIGLIIFLWPAAAFIGYLVSGIWIGDWILGRLAPQRVGERPYLAAVVGIVVLEVMGIIPPLVAIASLFGFGAVILAAWRSFRGPRTSTAFTARPAPWPVAG